MLAMIPGLMEFVIVIVVGAALVFAIIGTIRKYATPAEPKAAACPHCGGWSQATAKVCEHCGKELRQPHAVGPEPAVSSALAVSALVTGILGIFPNCLVLPAVAIVLALVARKRIKQSQGRLRGQAAVVAAMTLGCIGLVISAALLALPYAAQHRAQQSLFRSARQAVEKAESRIDGVIRLHGTPPDNDEGNQLLEAILDPWGQSIMYERHDGEYHVFSFGPDCEGGTEDDINGGTYWDSVLRSHD